MKRKVLKSRKVLIAGEKELTPAAILVDDGKINSIEPYQTSFDDAQTLDFGNQVIMPGIVDTHAHINEPGRTEWEGFVSATRAAASGGITTVIDMPLNSIPATTSLEALKIKAHAAEGNCTIDYGFWGGVVPGNLKELEPMIKAGVMGFKCFLCPSGVDEFENVTEKDLLKAMPVLAAHGVPLIVHAELEGPVEHHHLNSREYARYLESRPQSWEVKAVQKMIELAKETKCRTHIVHLSSADALISLQKAKSDRIAITAETCPHYLALDAESIEDGATHFKCAPPIREKQNQQRLWSAVEDGTIDFIVSDHSPCTPKLKLMESGDFDHAWGGIAGLQFSLPVVWTEMKKRQMQLHDLSRCMSLNTATFLGIENRKGRIAEGCDADLIIWNPDEKFVVVPERIHHRHKVTPYLGRELYGVIEKTFIRGELVYDSGAFADNKKGKVIWK